MKRKAADSRGEHEAAADDEVQQAPSFGQQMKAALKAFADKWQVVRTRTQKPRVLAAVKVGAERVLLAVGECRASRPGHGS